MKAVEFEIDNELNKEMLEFLPEKNDRIKSKLLKTPCSDMPIRNVKLNQLVDNYIVYRDNTSKKNQKRKEEEINKRIYYIFYL